MTIETHFWATNGDNKNSPLTMAARQPSRQKLESSFSLPQEVQRRRNQMGVKGLGYTAKKSKKFKIAKFQIREIRGS